MTTLNEQQSAAVAHVDGPCLVLAGAGTGKTKVLIERVDALIKNGHATLDNIILVTFTNKAAREMKERLARLTGAPVTNSYIGTFHSICTRILRKYADVLGFDSSFSIIDQDDQTKLIKQIISADFPEEKENAKKIIACINKWKDKGYLANDLDPSDRYVGIYTAYQNRLKISNAFDFGDLLTYCIKLFKDYPDALKEIQDQFKYIMVDEYQDTNTAQYIWLKLLAGRDKNVFCVGDEDQSIYGWRGAEIDNILRFERDFEGCKTIRLEENYRSSQHIVKAASHLVSHNKNRMGKNLRSSITNDRKIIVQAAWDADDEAKLVCDNMVKIANAGANYNDMAILVRASFQTREFEERLMKLKIPYYIVGSTKFYDRMEIKDAIAYLRIIHQKDDSIAFERILNAPKRGVGLTSIKKAHAIAKAENVSFSEACMRYCEMPGVQSAKRALKDFFMKIEHWKNMSKTKPFSELVKAVLEQSGYLHHWQSDRTSEAQGRVENLKEFMRVAEDFKDLESFLDYVAVMIESNNMTKEGVQIMTLHAAKGLEFPYVYLPGWEEGLFPHQRALSESGEKGLEEERRLAYVGISRGKKQVWISYAMQRRYYQSWQSNILSRFIKELPEGHIHHYNPNGIEITSAKGGDEFIIGERVTSDQYGDGDVMDVDPFGVYVKFDRSGIKKLAHRFIRKVSAVA
ncbi:MAG: UvrD-helicase domain-containing protein [Alphaproteobacteria bacterium]|nr:MAG: UvrD-helicase domain-containing protein [Alphaproteobacteria bacterium]